MSEERRALVRELTAQRQSAGLSQTEIASRMGTSQSAVARLEAGDADARASTLERYAAAIGGHISWQLRAPAGLDGPGPGPGSPPGPLPARPAREQEQVMPIAASDIRLQRQPGFGLPPQLRVPGQPGQPDEPRWPAPPTPRGWPGRPGEPEPVTTPTRVWLAPGGWPAGVYERLLEQRIVLASGLLDGDAATRLSAQLLALDAEGDEPIRLEIQGLTADLSAALTVMGVLDVVGVPVQARAGGRISGPALGVLAACGERRAYPNAVFALAEPRVDLDGRASELAAREEQLRIMLDSLYDRLAGATGREVDEIRDDARQERLLTVDQATAYGLIHGLIHGPAGPR